MQPSCWRSTPCVGGPVRRPGGLRAGNCRGGGNGGVVYEAWSGAACHTHSIHTNR
jgi:hypothetical protein